MARVALEINHNFECVQNALPNGFKNYAQEVFDLIMKRRDLHCWRMDTKNNFRKKFKNVSVR